MAQEPDDVHHRPLSSSGGDRRPVPDPTVLTDVAIRWAISALEDKITARLDGRDALVDKRFTMNEEMRRELKEDSQREMSAALVAAKELVTKSEVNMKEQVGALGRTVEEGFLGFRRDLDSLRERATSSENQKVGATEARVATRTETRDDRALIFGLIGAAFGLISLVMVLVRTLGGT